VFIAFIMRGDAVATLSQSTSKRFSTIRKQTRSVLVGSVLVLNILNARPSFAATAITISEGKNQVQVVLLADDVIRLRVGPGGLFPNDSNPEYVVIKPDSEWPGASNRSSDPNTIDTGKLQLVFTHNPLKLTISDHRGRDLVSNYRIDFGRPKAAWDLHSDEHVYGFGDKKNDIDKRGTRMDIWNVDTDFQDQSTGLMATRASPCTGAAGDTESIRTIGGVPDSTWGNLIAVERKSLPMAARWTSTYSMAPPSSRS
jgi:alpha-glucosidase (family GH31 glycosyl hydrolase)